MFKMEKLRSNQTILLIAIIFVTSRFDLVKSFECYSCQTGYTTSTRCSNQFPQGMSEECTGPNAQCYEAIKWFQNDTIKYIERRCWTPSNTSTSNDYCKAFSNPVGKLKKCRTCTTNLCNNTPILELNAKSVCY